jgi:hypothetical protein
MCPSCGDDASVALECENFELSQISLFQNILNNVAIRFSISGLSRRIKCVSELLGNSILPIHKNTIPNSKRSFAQLNNLTRKHKFNSKLMNTTADCPGRSV